MTPSSRRRFLIEIVATGAAVGTATPSFSQAGAHVDEADEQALALGYRHDTSKVDAKKYPSHANAQRCNNCSFWQGKADDAWAGCAMFGRKHVANAGWCQVWSKVPA